MLIPHWLKSLRNRLHRPVQARVSQKRRNHRVAPKQITTAVEFLEERMLLAGAGPQLISIFPNAGITQDDTGGRLQQNEVLEESPRELIFRFNPGQTLDPTSLADGIQVFRSGFDGVFLRDDAGNPIDQDPNGNLTQNGVPFTGNVNDDSVLVPLGSLRIGDLPNEVILRFANKLPDDHYKIQLKGSPGNPLRNSLQLPYNDGQDSFYFFEVDLGAKIEAVVHQPVVRTQELTVANTASLTDGRSFSLQVGGKPITFEFDTDGVSNNTSDGVFDNDNVFRINVDTLTTPMQFAAAIQTAFETANNTPGVVFGLTTAVSGNTITLTPTTDLVNPGQDTTFSPTITRGEGVSATDLTITDRGLQQRENYINVYFNANDELNANSTAENPTIVESPAFYQVISIDGTMRLPDSVRYNKDAGVATLFFEDVLEAGTYNIRIGESYEAANNLATTVNLGTQFGNSPVFTVNEFIGGDPTSTGLSEADVDLYRVVTPANGGGTVTITLAAKNGLTGRLRVFREDGTELTSMVAAVDGGPITYTTPILPAGEELIIGISSDTNAGYDHTNGSGAVDGGSTGSYRLTVESNTANISANDDNSSFATATDLGNLGTGGRVVNSQIEAQTLLDLLPPEPGGAEEHGHREIPVGGENHIPMVDFVLTADALQDVGRGTDPYAPDTIPVFAYTFAKEYGQIGGVTQFNQITAEQKQRAREIFEIYSQIGGLQFFEVNAESFDEADSIARARNVPGFQRTLHIVTGDLRVLGGTPGQGGTLGIAQLGGSLTIMDNDENFTTQDNLYGNRWFQIAFHEIGHLLGLAHTTELISIMNGFSGLPGEPIFPTPHDITHVRRIYRRDSVDVDMYKFEVTEAGRVTVETLAERLANASQLNTVLQLYRENSNGTRTLIAQNDDYYGNDSFLQLELEAGTYFIGVSSVGNEDYDPQVSDSGANGTSDGVYELRIELLPGLQPVTDPGDANDVSAKGRSAIYDTDNSDQSDGDPRNFTAFDGDADGKPGGTFSFSFQVSDNTSTNPTPNTIFVDKSPTNTTVSGPLGSITNPYKNIQDALAAAKTQKDLNTADNDPTPVIVRIVGNSGADGEIGNLGDGTRRANALRDNHAYQVGFRDNGSVLVDGFRLQAPKDVNVIVDAGAIIKLQDANLEVGSSSQGLDRSGGSLQLLGTSFNDVILTSWHNDLIGGDTDGNGAAPRPGDWGGVVFREDSDFDFEYVESEVQKQIFRGSQFHYSFTGFPIPATDATLTFTAFGNFAQNSENLLIEFVDPSSPANVITMLPTYTLFNTVSAEVGESDIAGADERTITARIRLTADQLARLAEFGDEIRIRVTPSNDVDNLATTESLNVRLAVGTAVPIFLNTVNHTTIQYAGGPVVVDSNSQDFDSIHLFNTRPTISYNTLEFGAKSAISANPNSFFDSFDDPRRFDHDLDRLGPNIHDNTITTHAVNGIKVRNALPTGNAIEKLSLPARFTATDIVYVLTENLQIDGSPGGLIVDRGSDPTITTDDSVVKRTPGRLRIDPGVIVKLNDARIEMERGGSNLIAEGTPEAPVIFTSLQDDTIGAGGTFDTANDGAPFEDIGLFTLDVAWTAQGPAPALNGQVEPLNNPLFDRAVTGAIHTVIAHPTNSDRVWIGATNGGVWRTDNATSDSPTWTPLTDFNESLSIGAMALDPNDSNRMLVGIGRFSSYAQEGGANSGLLLSENGGDAFTIIDPTILRGENISGVAVNGNVLLATSNNFDGTGGLFRSVNNGATWTLISGTNGLAAGAAFDLVSDPVNLDRHYITVAGVGVFRSDDGGNNWTNISASDATLNNAFTTAVDNNNAEMAVSQAGNRLYVAVIDQGQPVYIGYTDNLGSTWVQMDLPLTQEPDGTIVGISPRVKPGSQGSIHFSIVVDPNNSNIVYVGGDRQAGPFTNSLGAETFTGKLFRGDTTVARAGDGVPFSPQWQHITHSQTTNPPGAIVGGGTASNSAPHADSREMVFLANGDLIQVDDGGIFRRTPNTTTNLIDNTGDWFSIVGNLQVAEVHNIAYDSVANVGLIGTQDNGTQLQSAQDSLTWSLILEGDGGDVAIGDNYSSTVLGTSYFRYYSSQFLGQDSFGQSVFFLRQEMDSATGLPIGSPVAIDTTPVTDAQFTTPIALNKINPNRMVIGGSGTVYESLDITTTATINPIAAIRVNEGPNIAYGGMRNGVANQDVLWIGSGNQVYLRSVPSGTLNLTNYSGGEVRGVFMDPSDWMTAFVIDSDSVFMTTNGGATFTDITGPTVFDTNLRSLTYIEGTGTDALLVGGANGVFAMSMQNPGIWFNLGNNLPNAPAYDMEYDAQDDVLVTGTLGRGVYAITGARDLIITELLANAPQPIGKSPAPGDWAGLVFNAASQGNLDYIELRYGGGTSPIEGGNAGFNPIEIIQADVRIANSQFDNNDDGIDAANTTDTNRIGRGANRPATIFVRGAQPIIVSSIFENNLGDVISIDVNSLNSVVTDDPGRATGEIYSVPYFGGTNTNLTTEYANNFGALVRNNRMAGNQFNGMGVRGATLTTEGIWDDTDIVHIVRDEIVVTNLHTFGGLRLQSSARESLVVKLLGANAGFTAEGEELDIVDRVGATLEILGMPGRPVILTSLFDNSVGAGFDPDGIPLTETVDPASGTPSPGDWRSILLDQFSNDRNVQVYNERERPTRGGDTNNITPQTPNASESLGFLAPDRAPEPELDTTQERAAADDNRKAGFEIHGFINTDNPTDQDVYNFQAEAGTEVWFDIDRTATSLDTILELISSDGSVVFASSDNSQNELFRDPGLATGNPTLLQGIGLPLRKDIRLGGDFYTTNPKDAGMRVILPGAPDSTNTYYIRVRSRDGLTSGEYQLQIRTRQVDEHPGSLITFSQIRYATDGIEVRGLPGHSPLVGEAGEPTENTPGVNDSIGSATPLGNILNSDQNTFSVAGNLSDIAATGIADDLDFYEFQVTYTDVQSSGGSVASLIFDIDYADGLARPDTSLYLFNSTGSLIRYATNSNVADDRPAPGDNDSLDDPSRGTAGALDPLLGTVQLSQGTYYIAVTAGSNRPLVLNQFTTANPAETDVRLEPIESIFRISADRIGSQISGTAQSNGSLTPLLDISNPIYDTSDPGVVRPTSSIVPWHLGDVGLFVSSGLGGATAFHGVNAFTGVEEIIYPTNANLLRPSNTTAPFESVRDIAIDRRNQDTSNIIAFDYNTSGSTTDANSGDLLTIDLENNAFPTVINRQGDGIITYEPNTANPPAPVVANDGFQIEAVTYNNGTLAGDQLPGEFRILAIGQRGNELNDPTRQLLFEYVTTSGAATSAPRQDRTGNALLPQDFVPATPTTPAIPARGGTQIQERGVLDTTVDLTSPAGTALVVPSAANLNGTFIIPDGALISLDDGITILEMDAGPFANFNVNLANNSDQVIRDGDYIQLDGVFYEFDTGVGLDVNANTDSQIAAGDRFTITDNAGNTIEFEFTFGGGVSNPNFEEINVLGANSQVAIANRIANAINSVTRTFNAQAIVLGNQTGRITLINDTDLTFTRLTTSQITATGNYGETITGSNLVSVEETFTSEQLALALGTRFATANSITQTGAKGSLVNFPLVDLLELDGITGPPARASFINPGVFVVGSFTGGVTGTNIEVNYFADQDGQAVAASILTQLTGAGITASRQGAVIQLEGGETFLPAPDTNAAFQIGGGAPGGRITGMTVLNSQLYVVTNTGGFFRVDDPTGFNAQLDYIETSFGLQGLNFQGLTTMPPNVEGGIYSDLLVAITLDGTLVAFNEMGIEQPVFVGGASQVSTGINNATGLTFSNLDENLWHTTNDNPAALGAPGGTKFAFNNERDGNVANNTYGRLLGGAHGTLETDSFSLQGYAAEDQPVLYFTYFLETEDANGGGGRVNKLATDGAEARDVFRVYIAGEDGVWDLLASNNTVDAAQQNLFDSTNWRQARIDLSAYAGESDLQLRFEFSTAGSLHVGNIQGAGIEIRAQDGDTMRDGDFIDITGERGGNPTNVRFEFNMGYTAIMPPGSQLETGDILQIEHATGTITYTFQQGGVSTNGDNINGTIGFSPTDTARTLASRLDTLLGALPGGFGLTPRTNGQRVNFQGAMNVVFTPATTTANPSIRVEGSATVGAGNIEVPIHSEMTDDEVATVLRQVIADNLLSTPLPLSSIKAYREVVVIIGRNVGGRGNTNGIADSVGLGLTRSLPESSVTNDNLNNGEFERSFRYRDNDFQGVYFDDIIIGFAERGEQVSGAGNNANFSFGGAPINEGNYQLEIRRGTEYSAGQLPVAPLEPNNILDTNDRLTDALTITVPDGEDLFDGQTFTLSDGVNVVTFEFDDDDLPTNAPNEGVTVGHIEIGFRDDESGHVIAARMRDLFNSAEVTSVLDITAALADGLASGLGAGFTNEVNVFGVISANLTGDVSDGAFDGNPNDGLIFESFANLANDYVYRGDSNQPRLQGQVQIAQNFIFDTLNVGIKIDDNIRRPGTDQPVIGVPRKLPVPNDTDRLTRGVNVVNNVVANFGDAGILLNGVDNSGAQRVVGAVPFHRVINNTIYGGSQPAGDGIRVTNNVDPTIANNIIANTNRAIVSGAGSNDIVVERSTYQNNGTIGNVGAGTDAQILSPQDPLFVNPGANNFYLAAGALPIDSARDQFQDRNSIVQVSASIGIPRSNLFAPAVDAFGQFRTNDEDTPNTGAGNFKFYDRGAVEREDIEGPIATLISPEDNDGLGNDLDPADSIVFLENPPPVRSFVIGLTDEGIGIEDSTVTTDNVILTRNGLRLISGVDYLFRYNTNSKQITLEAASGLFGEGTYTIQLINQNGIRDLAGNNLVKNQDNGDVTFQITISPSPGISITARNNGTVREGDTGDMPFIEFDVSLSGPSGSPISVDVATMAAGTGLGFADPGADYEVVLRDGTGNPLPSSTLTFNPGELTKRVRVQIIGDIIVEGDEIFFVNLSNSSGSVISTSQATGRINDDDLFIRLSGPSMEVAEGDPGDPPTTLPFEVQLVDDAGNPIVLPDNLVVQVDVVTADGTALATSDYTPLADPNDPMLPLTLTFIGDGNTADPQTVTVNIVQDEIQDEFPLETFFVNLANPRGGQIEMNSGQAIGTIRDDDPKFNVNNVTVVEGEDNTRQAVFTVSISSAVSASVSVNYAIQPGTAMFGTDYTAQMTTGTLTFNPGDPLTQTVAVTIIGDTLPEGDKSFNLVLSAPTAGEIAMGTGTATIVDDDPRISILDQVVMEGDPNTPNAVFTVQLSQASPNDVIVDFSTSLGNGVPAPGPGQIYETDPASTFDAPQVLDRRGFGRVANPNINDNTGSDVSGTIDHITILGRGNDAFDYFAFDGVMGQRVILDIDTATFNSQIFLYRPDGTRIVNDDGFVNGVPIGGRLDAGSDSTEDAFLERVLTQTGRYIIAVGRSTSTATSNGLTGTPLQSGDKYTLHVSLSNYAVTPGANVSGPTPTDGTALPGSDFDPNGVIPASGQLIIPAGQLTGTISIPITNDQANELDEVFFVRLNNAVGGVIEDGTAVGTILDDDAPKISISDGIPIPPITNAVPGPVRETDARGLPNVVKFDVRLSRPADLPTTINFATANGTAIAGQDYIPVSGQLNFAVGEQFKTITVQLIKDGQRNESPETFFVNLSNPVGADFVDSQGVGTIIDSTGFVERVLAVVAPDAGQPGIVRVLDANGGERFSFEPYPGFMGGVRVATGDVNNDGTPDIVTVPGPGGGPHVKAFSGVDGTVLLSFLAYDPNFTGGLYVAVGDFAEGVLTQGDSFDDIIVAPDAGGGPHVRVFSTATGGANNRTFTPANIQNRLLFDFPAYNPNFLGGVRVAAGDVTGDGVDDLVTAPGQGGGPHIQVFNGRFTGPNNIPSTTRDGRSFLAYVPNFTGGVYVAVGDVDTRVGAEGAEIITGPGTGGGPHVRVFNVRNLGTGFALSPSSLSQFFAYDSNFLGGVRVAVGFANDTDTNLDILTMPGIGGGADLRAYSGASVSSPARGNNILPQPQIVAGRVPFGGLTGSFVAGVSDVDVQFVGAALRATTTDTTIATTPLTQQDVDAARAAALDRFRNAGVSEADIAHLSQVRITVDDLSGDLLGLATTGGIVLDVNAAGNGWFIDPTPGRDEEFAGTGSELRAIDLSAARRMDLLTVVMHELGHKLGLDDLHSQLHPDALMTAKLPVGTRRLPTSEELDEAFTDDSLFDSLLLN